MDLTSLPKFLWTSDSKFLQHHFPDILATVYTTQEIPEGTNFGPCVFPYAFLDTIGFIALKCVDNRNIHYVFKVDAVGAANGPTGPAWMRLVQAARDSRDQNLEAYLKNSQLYFRAIRKIPKNAELLVWYDEAISHLLRFPGTKNGTSASGYKCPDCDQEFKSEYPYFSHVRFLCVPDKYDPLNKTLLGRRNVKTAGKDSINFHRLARDLEGNSSRSKEDEDGGTGSKASVADGELPKSRKTVLLETTNQQTEAQCSGSSEGPPPENIPGGLPWKVSAKKHLYKKHFSWTDKQSAFTEVEKSKDRLKHGSNRESGVDSQANCPDQEQHPQEQSGSSSGSAFSWVWPSRGGDEERSAFSKPSKCDTESLASNQLYPMHESTQSLRDALGFLSTSDVRYYGANSCKSSAFVNNLCNSSTTMPTSLTRSQAFPYTSEQFAKPRGMQLHTSSSLALLPPTLTTMGVSAQNWCAKCNLSFRMTADLVFHMRSHHKKESAMEAPHRRRREEKLTCPICHEYFKERHHLSRHMTSHN